MPENVGALSLASAEETFPLASFDQLQKHGQIQCEKLGNSVFSSCVFFTVNIVNTLIKKLQIKLLKTNIWPIKHLTYLN